MTHKTKYEAYGVTGYAWSVMQCWNKGSEKDVDHPPHVWDSQHMCYGPYWCEGKNPTWQFNDKDIVSELSDVSDYVRLVRVDGKWFKLVESHNTDESVGQVIEAGFAKKVK